jgi:hypothetical protein
MQGKQNMINAIILQKPYDAVLIVGPDHSEKSIKQVRDAYEESGMSYKIIGDGKRQISFAEIKRELNSKLTSNTRIDIWGHGSVDGGIHNINIHDKSSEEDKKLAFLVYDRSTIDLIRFLQTHCYHSIRNKNTLMHIHVFSCYAGAVEKSITQHDNEISLILHGGKKYSTQIAMNAIGIVEGIKFHKFNKNPTDAFAHIVATSPETANFVEVANRKVEVFKYTAPKVSLFMSAYGSRQYIHSKLSDFSKFCESLKRNDDVFIPTINEKNYRESALVMESGREKSKKALDYVSGYIESGVGVNAQIPGSGMTALHWAAYADNLLVAKKLVESGADVEMMDSSSRKPSDIAKQKKHDPMQNYLLEKENELNLKRKITPEAFIPEKRQRINGAMGGPFR